MLIKQARKIVIFVIGGTVLLVGLLLLFLPGPGWLTIIAGLAILGSEFAWAAWLLKRLKRQATTMVNAVWGQGKNKADRPQASPQGSSPD